MGRWNGWICSISLRLDSVDCYSSGVGSICNPDIDHESSIMTNRDTDILTRACDGVTYKAIGAEYGISAERVRQIAADAAETAVIDLIAVRAEKRAQLRAAAVEDACDTIPAIAAKHPDATINEIARLAGPSVTAEDVTRVLDAADVLRRVTQAWPSLGNRFTAEQCLNALRAAAKKIDGPVTMVLYRKHARKGAPSARTIMNRVGKSWRETCEAAGVVPGVTARSFEVRWSEDDLRNIAVQFFTEHGPAATSAQYEAWAAANENMPSLATMRSRLGSWGNVRAAAAEVFAQEAAA